MVKATTPKKDKPKSLAEAGLESFTTREIHRKQLVGAIYNPRVITDQERTKLKKAIARHGLVAPVTWNERTGNIVGGHQRIGIMDSLMKTGDYSLTVAVIDVDEAKEKELNVLLNNTSAQGSWDMDGLKKMFGDESVTLEGAGFDIGDMIDLFGDDSLNERAADLAEFAEKLADLSSTYNDVSARNKAKLDGEFFCVLVFPDAASMQAMFKHVGVKDSRYQNGQLFAERLGVEAVTDDE
jgi:hypothetical protein